MLFLIICSIVYSRLNVEASKREMNFSSVFPSKYDEEIFQKKLTRRALDPLKKEVIDIDSSDWVGEDLESEHSFDSQIILKRDLSTIRLRPSIYSLSKKEKRKLIRVFHQLNSGPRPTAWDQLTKLHILNYQFVHLQPYFLAWHRAYVYRLEEAMLEIDSTVSIPYWDWTIHNREHQNADPVFGDDLFGGNGDPKHDNCLTSGPFSFKNFPILYDQEPAHDAFRAANEKNPKKKFTINEINLLVDDDKNLNTENELKCIKRKFRPKEDAYKNWNSMEKMTEIENSRNPIDFWHFVELGGHGHVHNAVGSERATDPLFFLLHTFVDKIWFDWQNKNPDLAFKYPVKEEHLSMNLNPFGVTINELLDPVNNMGYGYDEYRYDWSKKVYN